MRFKAIVIIVLASSFAVPATAGPLEDAKAAERSDDCTTALSIYGSLAAKGVAQAYSRLGYLSEIGYCGKRDWLQSARWYGKAIEAGDQASAANLSHIGRNWRFMYRNVPMDPIIYELIEQAAKNGIAVAQFSLGVMNYPIGDLSFDPTKGNLSEALIWYRRAADQGDVDAMVAMGMAYAGGIGVPQDYVEAHKWYNIAAPRTTYGDIRNDIMKRRDDLSLKMTAAQTSEAQKLARDWKPK